MRIDIVFKMLNTLPPELLIKIAEYLDSYSLKCLSEVNSYLFRITEPALCSSHYFASRDFDTNIDHFIGSKRHYKHLSVLILSDSDEICGKLEGFKGRSRIESLKLGVHNESFKSVLSLLALLKNVKEVFLDIKFQEISEECVNHMEPITNVKTLKLQGYSKEKFPLCGLFTSLRTLEIHQVDSENDYDIGGYNEDTLTSLIELNVTTLRVLRLNVFLANYSCSIPISCQLEEFQCNSFIDYAESYNVDSLLMYQSSLQKLRLKGIKISDVELIDLLLRNYQLQELVLSYCTIEKDRDYHESIKEDKKLENLDFVDLSYSRIHKDCIERIWRTLEKSIIIRTDNVVLFRYFEGRVQYLTIDRTEP